MVDLHSHILPGLDDGAGDLEASLAIARAAVEDGTTIIVATPHVSLDYDTRPEAILEGVESLQSVLEAEGIALRVVAGAEVSVPRLSELDDDTLRVLSIGTGPYLLVESPYSDAPFLEDSLFGLQTRGFRTLLAHPERCPLFQRDRGRLARLVDQGVLCSVTAGSITGRFGRRVRGFSHDLLREQLVHDISSDVHDTDRRPPGIRAAARDLRSALPELAGQVEWLTRDVPQAIVEGDPLPRRPAAEDVRTRSWRPWRM